MLKEDRIWEMADKEKNGKLKFRLELAAIAEGKEDLIKELREDAAMIMRHPDFDDDQKRVSVGMIISAIKAIRENIEKLNYQVVGK